jgi:hypothetical protein
MRRSNHSFQELHFSPSAGGTYFIPTVPGHAAAEEQQIARLDGLDISAERRRRLRELDT